MQSGDHTDYVHDGHRTSRARWSLGRTRDQLDEQLTGVADAVAYERDVASYTSHQ